MSQEPLVSIVINSYNYGRFLSDAIDSALGQSYSNTEVIVVDDGSTDDSRQIIEGYGDRIIPALKENGGQASAMNVGFAHSHGEIVIFLDSDDMLLPDTSQRVLWAFQANPGIARVQYRLAVVDATGEPTGDFVPAAYVRMPSGDLRHHIRELNNYTWWPPTSGHAFAASTLRQILPIPELAFRIAADYYLVRASALCGPIVSLDGAGAYYRLHGSNHSGYKQYATIDLNVIHWLVTLTRDSHPHLKKLAERLGFHNYPAEVTEGVDITFLAQRMALLKLDSRGRLIEGDTLWSLFRHGVAASLQHSNLTWPLKVAYVLWFAVITPASQPLARWLVEKFFHPAARRGRFNKLLDILHRAR